MLLMCPACDSQAYTILRDNCHDLVCGCAGQWSLAECTPCGLIYTIPHLSPSELLNYYPAKYSSYNPVGALRTNWLISLFRRAVMWPYFLRFGSPDWLEAETPFGGGRLLDIGCGAGLFLQAACNLGWHGWGVDVSPLVVEMAQINAPKAKIWVATLDDLELVEQFDLINLSHVLEHLPNPRRALGQCFDLLVPGGKLRISIPNIGSFEAKFFGHYWRGLDIPRHLVHFRVPVIESLIREMGFAEVTIRPAMFASSISESMILALPKKIRYRVLDSRAARYLYLLMVFPAALSYLFGNRGVIEITAQKPS